MKKEQSTTQQVRVMLKPEALRRASLIAQETGLSMSQIVNDALIRASVHQAKISKQQDYKSSKQEFMDALKKSKREVMNS
mgnify:CR=1 FL=1